VYTGTPPCKKHTVHCISVAYLTRRTHMQYRKRFVKAADAMCTCEFDGPFLCVKTVSARRLTPPPPILFGDRSRCRADAELRC